MPHQPSLTQSCRVAGYVWDKGMSGQALHGGPEPAAGYSGSFGFDSAARQFHTDQVNVAWQLSDVGPSDGGFVSDATISLGLFVPSHAVVVVAKVAIRGSHKSAYSVHDVRTVAGLWAESLRHLRNDRASR